MNGDSNFPRRDQNQPLSSGGGFVPPTAPPPEIGIRTMESDVKYIEESGGESPKPYTPKQLPDSQPLVAQPPISEERFQPQLNVPGYQGPEEPVFQTPDEQTFVAPPEGGEQLPPAKKGKGMKMILWIVIGLAVAGGLGAAGYFYIFPIFFPAEPPAEPAPPLPVSLTEPKPTTTLPDGGAPKATFTLTPPPPIPAGSFFQSVPPQEKISVILLDANAIKINLNASAAKSKTGDFKEIIFQKEADGANIKMSELLPLVIKGLPAQDFKLVFEENLAAFLWIDDKGAWPGYVLKSNLTATPQEIQADFSKLETTADFKTMFLKDPGPVKQTFKDGQADAFKTRYQIYSVPGAAINYGWKDNFLVISASYGGFLETVKRL